MQNSKSKTIIICSPSATTKKIIRYSLENRSFESKEAKTAVPEDLDKESLLIVDSTILNTQWKSFLQKCENPYILLDGGDNASIQELSKQNNCIILKKPFKPQDLYDALDTFEIEKAQIEAPKKVSKKPDTQKGIKTPEFPESRLPQHMQEQLKQEALAFISDYCKSHFRNIAEDILLKEIRRLSEERNSLLDEV